MVGATTVMGKEESMLNDKSRTVKQADHSGTSGISVSLLWERFTSPRLGSSRRHLGILTNSLCCRSILTTCRGKSSEVNIRGINKG